MIGAVVLPEDVEIIPLAKLPASIRAQIGADGHEYAVTRPRSRVPSKVIDGQAAELLRQFKKPTTLVEAILRFSKTVGREPTQILEEVYPFLESCLMAKLLVEPGAASEAIRASFDRGDLIANWQVQECIQALSDTELYRVRGGNLEAALKIARTGSGRQVKQSLEREAAILSRLNGRVAPRIIFSGELDDGRTYFVMEWIAGDLCGEAAAAMRAAADEPLPAPLLALCSKILDAYATLHDLGVIHSDVHPNNLLVMRGEEVRIIDLGLSRADTGDLELAPPRAGVGFFFEPEYAKAVLAGAMPPLSSRAGDQYSVAALVYSFLSGRHYLDFSYGKEEMLHQIAEQPTIPLTARGLRCAGALDEVLSRALSKDLSARFPDMHAMADAFRDTVNGLHRPAPGAEDSSASDATAMPHDEFGKAEDWLESILESLSDPDMGLPIVGIRYPTASLTYGAAGIAYGLFRIACVREDAGLCALAERWLDRAAREIGSDAGFYQADVGITPETVGRISPYHLPAGVACVQALIAHSFGDWYGRSRAVERFLQFSERECESLDLTVGRSGTLLALSTLVDAFGWDKAAEQERLVDAGNKLFADLWRQLDAMPSIPDEGRAANLAMAHGWAGYLYATLRWSRSAQISPPSGCQARLAQLAEKAQWLGSRAFWPSQAGSGSSGAGGWCSGSAGFVFLWTLAHRLWPDPQWLSLAKAAGHDAFHARDEGLSLCCGLTGKAYSQLNLFKHTGDRNWLDNAHTLAKLAVRTAENAKTTAEPRIPFSLYKGDLGLAVMVAELEHPECSALPFLEDEAWPTRRR